MKIFDISFCAFKHYDNRPFHVMVMFTENWLKFEKKNSITHNKLDGWSNLIL